MVDCIPYKYIGRRVLAVYSYVQSDKPSTVNDEEVPPVMGATTVSHSPGSHVGLPLVEFPDLLS